jgi:benzoate-CoA ligase
MVRTDVNTHRVVRTPGVAAPVRIRKAIGERSGASGSGSTPRVPYNAAVDLLDSNLGAGRADRIAYIDERGSYTYAGLQRQVNQFANVLKRLGLEREDRIVLSLLDTVDFPACFLGAIKAGFVPVPLNTLLRPADYAQILLDCCPKAVIVSDILFPAILEGAEVAEWKGQIVVSGKPARHFLSLDQLRDVAATDAIAAPTSRDDVCFCLYSSGTTGKPKGVIHLHKSLAATARNYAQGVLGIRETDIVFSAAKLFFAYGLGNALTFPLSVGATAILSSHRATPDIVTAVLNTYKPTIFCGVPTLFGSLLSHRDLPDASRSCLRISVSAGEALPESIGQEWRARTRTDILDGIGSTEMLHIFISNRPDSIRYGTTGVPVPHYRARLIDDSGADLTASEVMGDLFVSGPSAAAGYWNNPERTRETFQGEWVRTGDRFYKTEDGSYVFCGRTDEMLKVGGNWVSPIEVESAILKHGKVCECAVVGAVDEHGLVKPKAFVVLKSGVTPEVRLDDEIKNFVKQQLAPYKYPRWIEFVDELPKTATGKLRRSLLRQNVNDGRETRDA